MFHPGDTYLQFAKPETFLLLTAAQYIARRLPGGEKRATLSRLVECPHTTNNPVKYIDPTGHYYDDGCQTEGCTGDPSVTIRTRIINTDNSDYEISDPLYMKPSKGVESRAVAAEQGYNEFSTGGYEHPIIAGIGMISYEWELILQSDWRELAGRTEVGRYVHGGPDAYGVIYFSDLQDGTRVVTDIAISNHSHHDITVNHISVTGFDSNNDHSLGYFGLLSSSDALCFGPISPGVTSNPIPVRQIAYTPGEQYIVLKISLKM